MLDVWIEQGGERIIGYVPHGSAMEACSGYNQSSQGTLKVSESQGTLTVRNGFHMFWVVCKLHSSTCHANTASRSSEQAP